MWNNKKSMILSRIFIFAFMIIAVLGVLFGYQLITWFIGFSRAEVQGKENLFMITSYSSAVFVIATLYQLNRLLSNIASDQIFIANNVKSIRICSWCCFVVAFICLISTCYYAPFFIVSIGVAFMGLLLRIIKNIFEKAIQIQEENEFTI